MPMKTHYKHAPATVWVIKFVTCTHRVTWNKAFVEALEHDAWGQVEEAVETYQRLQVAAAAVRVAPHAHLHAGNHT